jgi:hypothetical protein
MTSLSDFDLDFRFGQQGENSVANLLSIETVEVKTDRRWKETGNVYIETYFYSLASQDWIPSGINITKATHWAFKLEDAVLLVETPKLIEAIKEYGVPISTPIEPNPSKGFLMKPENILRYIKDSSEHTK